MRPLHSATTGLLLALWPMSAVLTGQTMWARHDGNPVFLPSGCGTGWDCGNVHDVSVLLDGGTYRMWYAGSTSGRQEFAIGYATSPDGVEWTRHPGPCSG